MPAASRGQVRGQVRAKFGAKFGPSWGQTAKCRASAAQRRELLLEVGDLSVQ